MTTTKKASGYKRRRLTLEANFMDVENNERNSSNLMAGSVSDENSTPDHSGSGDESPLPDYSSSGSIGDLETMEDLADPEYSSDDYASTKFNCASIEAEFKEKFIKKLEAINEWARNPSIPSHMKKVSFRGSKLTLFEHLHLLLEQRIKGSSWTAVKDEIMRLDVAVHDLRIPLSIDGLKEMLDEIMFKPFKFFTCEEGYSLDLSR